MKNKVNKFGQLKSKIVSKLTESYINKKTDTIKKLIKKINENKDLKEMFLYYDEFESLQITESGMIDDYINEVESLLKSKNETLQPLYESLSVLVYGVEYVENPVYSMLDNLLEEKSLSNVDLRLKNKQDIKNHLQKEKTTVTESKMDYTSNERLLSTLLTTEFNNTYTNSLTESEKELFEEIINFTPTELTENYNQIKKQLTEKLSSLILETKDDISYQDKLNEVKKQIDTEMLDSTRFNYVKLKQLNQSL